jgi:hypothetical protein
MAAAFGAIANGGTLMRPFSRRTTGGTGEYAGRSPARDRPARPPR